MHSHIIDPLNQVVAAIVVPLWASALAIVGAAVIGGAIGYYLGYKMTQEEIEKQLSGERDDDLERPVLK